MAREDTTSQDLYDLLVTHNLDPEITDERGQAAQPDSGRVFTFDWTSETGTNYGTAVVLITDDGELQLFFGDNLGRGMEEPDKTEWYDFMQQLSRFAARNNFLTFSPKNLNRLKHAMAGMAAIREGLFEGYYGTKKVSYMGEQRQARLMIRHKHDLAETDRRHLNVESLFIETVEGERFKLPFRDLRGGKAMLTHVREGGRPYDVRGVHIAEMVEELKVLSRFNRASAGRVTEGVTQELVEQARVYYRNLRESMRRMGGHRGYQQYFETWTPLTETESESLVEDIKTLFTEQTLDTRIEAALPVLARIKETNMREADIFESYIDRLAEGTWAVPDTPEAERKLQELMAQELPVGPDATNATEQLFDLIGDDELYDQLEQLARDDPDADARPLIQARLEEMGYNISPEQNDQDLDEALQTLPFGTVNVGTPADQRAKHKKFVQDLVADGVAEKTAYEVLDFVRNEVARGVSWDDAVEVALQQYGIDDPYRLEREKEREQAYNADQARVRQQMIKKLQNFYKQARQRQGQEKAQAIALLRRYWPQATDEQKAELNRQFGDEPEWQEIMRKVEQQPRLSEVDAQAAAEPVNVQGLTLDQWKRRVTGAGGKVLGQLAKMPNAPVVAMIRGKKYHWQDQGLSGKSLQSAQGRLQQQATQRASGKMNEADNLSTFEGAGCNHTMEGESCPVHGSKACDMSESDDREDYNQTADELNRAREAGDMERIKQLSGQLSKQAGPRGFEIDIRGNARPLKESDELARLKNIVSSKTQ